MQGFQHIHTYIHTYIHTDRQTDRQSDIHTYQHIHIYVYYRHIKGTCELYIVSPHVGDEEPNVDPKYNSGDTKKGPLSFEAYICCVYKMRILSLCVRASLQQLPAANPT